MSTNSPPACPLSDSPGGRPLARPLRTKRRRVPRSEGSAGRSGGDRARTRRPPNAPDPRKRHRRGGSGDRVTRRALDHPDRGLDGREARRESSLRRGRCGRAEASPRSGADQGPTTLWAELPLGGSGGHGHGPARPPDLRQRPRHGQSARTPSGAGRELCRDGVADMGCAVPVGEDAFRSGCRRQNSPRMKLNDGHGLTERISRRIPSDPPYDRDQQRRKRFLLS